MINKLWLFSGLIFVVLVLSGPTVVMTVNSGALNHLLTPVAQYWSLFQVLLQDNPIGAMQFILTKTIVAFAHKDPRSGLNLWTFELDSITLISYMIIAIYLGWLVNQRFRQPQLQQTGQRRYIIGSAGALLLAFTFSYMTSIEHCSGATWVGFVSAYGVGLDSFDFHPLYQWVLGIVGLTAMTYAMYSTRNLQTEWAHLQTVQTDSR